MKWGTELGLMRVMAALFVVVKNNGTNHTSPDNRLKNKLQYIHLIEYNTGMKMSQIQPSTLSKKRLGAKYYETVSKVREQWMITGQP